MEGITKVIEELGNIIVAKDIELEFMQEEINKLRKKVETVEQCLEIYEACYTKKDK
ncbi:MAG: hypothetical protein IKY27_00155 [Bacteroidales bacterium]|nr:hypothetical protein [Bacteroidales bacterium]